MKLTGPYKLQAKFKGKIVVSNLDKEAFTQTWYADVFDSDTGESRTIDPVGPYLIIIDPKNKKKRGIEIIRVESIVQVGDRITFTNSCRGLSKDDFDDVGGVALAQNWIVGTEIGIVTDFMNSNFVKDLIAGERRFQSALDFAGGTNHRSNINFTYTPAFLTGGATPTTTISTWTAVNNGEFTITIDGVVRNITGIDFTSGVGGMDQVANKIEDKIRTITSGSEEVEWTGTRFIIRSGLKTSSSAITVTSTFGGGVGTDISGAGATQFLDSDIGNGVVTVKNKGLLLSATVADITERDALTGVVDGAECYVIADGVKYDRLAGSWLVRDTGVVTPNGTDAIAGKWEGATVAEQGTQAPTGDTGAGLVLQPKNLVKSSSGAGDENKIPVLGSNGKFAAGFIPAQDNLVDIQEFSADGTWTKPTSFSPEVVMVVLFGAGGGGAGATGGVAGTLRSRGSGGGGGARIERIFRASDLAATVAVTIGVGGTAGTGGTNAVGTVGTAGGDTTFGTHLTAYGGGCGALGDVNGECSGGGGGGSASAGNNGSTASTVPGGSPGASSGSAIGNQGGQGGSGQAENGGGGGGGGNSNPGGNNAGGSLYGGGGGGGGGNKLADGTEGTGGGGGPKGVYSTSNTGGGAVNGGAGSNGSAGDFNVGGGGGGGGGSQDSGTGGVGGNGAIPAGGGGGGGAGNPTGGAGGTGARGHAYVISW